MRGLRGQGWRSGAWRHAGVLLVALAFAVRLATPAGWMLSASASGPTLVICTGHGLQTLPDPGKTPGHAPDKSSDHPCVFAGAHAAPTPAALIAIPTGSPAPVDAAPSIIAADQRPGRGLAAPPPPSHGPPLTA